MEEITLKSIVDNELTDKNTQHTYLDLYQRLLSKKSDTAKNVLEVGIGVGGSIKMWHDFFPNAHIYGGYHAQLARATKCGGWGRRRWGTLDSARNKLTQNNAGDGAAGGGVRWIGRATCPRDKTWGMSLGVSL